MLNKINHIFSSKKVYFILLAVILINLSIRLFYVIKFTESQKLYWPDEKQYVRGAKEITKLNCINEYFTIPIRYKREPLYALFLAPFYKVFANNFFIAVRIFQSFVFVAIAFVIYCILTSVSKPMTAFLGFFYVLFYPYYIYLGGTLLPETIYTLIIAILVLLGVKIWYKKETKNYYYFSFFLAIAYLTKTTALSLFIVLLFMGYIIYCNKRIIWHIPFAVLIFMLICSPFWYRNFHLGHKNVFLSRNDSAIMVENPYFSQPDKSITFRIVNSLKMIPDNTKRFFTLSPGDIQSGNHEINSFIKWISIITVVPLFFGLIAGVWLFNLNEIRFLYLFYMFYALPYLVILGDTRYRLPIDIIGIILFVIIIQKSYLNRYPLKQRL